ncbi:hypothetical protein SDC9_203783 [bioreactor metagenome]|uniref:Uncharacterized protein n=1 Tax=bioreactor metagenome TaxID=1076179 RepID=A0A645IY73_9ZZZZ
MLGPQLDPGVEMLRAHVLKLHVTLHQVAAKLARSQHHGAPEIHHAIQVRLPARPQFLGKDRAEQRVCQNVRVEVQHQAGEAFPVQIGRSIGGAGVRGCVGI